MNIKNCKHCGKTFEQTWHNASRWAVAKYCSNKCGRYAGVANKGRKRTPFSAEWRERLGASNRGRKFSEDHKAKISKAMMGHKVLKKTRVAVSKAHKGKPISEEQRLKLSIAGKGKRLGDKNPMWAGGLSQQSYPLTFSNYLKRRIRIRDNRICQHCGVLEDIYILQTSRILDIHHIDYNKDNCSESNLIALCHGCNIRANVRRIFWQEYFQAKVQGAQIIRESLNLLPA